MNQSQDVEEDENDSDDDNTNPEAYSVQNDGWHIVEKLRMETVQNHLVNLSPYSIYPSLRCRYQVVIISVALALGCDALQHNPAENSHAESERLLLLLWDVLQYSKQSNSPFSVLQTIPPAFRGYRHLSHLSNHRRPIPTKPVPYCVLYHSAAAICFSFGLRGSSFCVLFHLHTARSWFHSDPTDSTRRSHFAASNLAGTHRWD